MSDQKLLGEQRFPNDAGIAEDRRIVEAGLAGDVEHRVRRVQTDARQPVVRNHPALQRRCELPPRHHHGLRATRGARRVDERRGVPGLRFDPLTSHSALEKVWFRNNVERQRRWCRVEAAEHHAVLHMAELMRDVEERLAESRFGQHDFRLRVVHDVAQPVTLVVRVDGGFDGPQPRTAQPGSVRIERIGENRHHRPFGPDAEPFQGIGPAQRVGIRLAPPQGRSVHMLQRDAFALLRGAFGQHLRHEVWMVKGHGHSLTALHVCPDATAFDSSPGWMWAMASPIFTHRVMVIPLLARSAPAVLAAAAVDSRPRGKSSPRARPVKVAGLVRRGIASWTGGRD